QAATLLDSNPYPPKPSRIADDSGYERSILLNERSAIQTPSELTIRRQAAKLQTSRRRKSHCAKKPESPGRFLLFVHFSRYAVELPGSHGENVALQAKRSVAAHVFVA